MKRWLWISLGLALAASLITADLGWAQCQGGYGPGRGRGAQASQSGAGQGYATCPNYPGNQYCVQGTGNAGGRGRGMRRGGNTSAAPSSGQSTDAPTLQPQASQETP